MTMPVSYQDDLHYAELFGSGTASAVYAHSALLAGPGIYKAIIDLNLFSEEWAEPGRVDFLAEYEMRSKVDVIQQFASRMLSNLKDMDPAFAKIAKEHFWDLI